MAVTKWSDNDAGYLAWTERYPDRFLANVTRSTRPSYFQVHRATCHLPDRSGPDTKNPWTGNQYRKITVDTLEELWSWGEANGFSPARKNFCQHCCSDLSPPANLGAVDATPTTDFVEYVRRAERLRERRLLARPTGIAKPQIAQGTTTLFYRDPAVRAWALQRAEGRCELCSTAAPFLTDEGGPYLESHHIIMLSEGGADTPDNTAALCPNCHRNLRYGSERLSLRERLSDAVLSKEAVLTQLARGVRANTALERTGGGAAPLS